MKKILKYMMINDDQKVEFTTPVIVVNKNGYLQLDYVEPTIADNDDQKHRVRIKIFDEQVKITRSGTAEMTLEMQLNRTKTLNYQMANFSTQFQAKLLSLYVAKECDKIDIEYSLIFNDNQKQDYKIFMELEVYEKTNN